MTSKTITLGALALSLGFAGLASASDLHAGQSVGVTIADDSGVNADCSGRCNGSCSSGGDDDGQSR